MTKQKLDGGAVLGWRFILSLIFSVIVALFAIANSGVQRVNFIVASYDVSMAIVILVSAIGGAVIVLLLSIVKSIKLNLKISSQEKTIAALQKEKEIFVKKVSELEKKNEELIQIPEIAEVKNEVSAEAEPEVVQKEEKKKDIGFTD